MLRGDPSSAVGLLRRPEVVLRKVVLALSLLLTYIRIYVTEVSARGGVYTTLIGRGPLGAHGLQNITTIYDYALFDDSKENYIFPPDLIL